MSKRVMAWLTVLSILILALAGCGGNNSKGAASGGSTSSTKDEKFKLVVWRDFGKPPEGKPPIQDIILKKMREKYPNIEIEYVNKGWAEELRQNVLLAATGGNAPDIVIEETFFSEFARLGLLLPLPTDLYKDQLEAPLIKATVDGKVYGVSSHAGVLAVFYNKKIMKAAGLDPNKPPATWDEWLEQSKKITAAGKGEYYANVIQGVNLGGTFRVLPFVRMVGSDYTADNDKKLMLNSPEMLKAYTLLRSLIPTTPPGSSVDPEAEKRGYDLFHADKVAFIIDGPWRSGRAVEAKNDFGIAALPLPPGGRPGNVVLGNVLMGAMKASKHKEAAIDYLRVIASEDFQDLTWAYLHVPPANKKSLDKLLSNAPDWLQSYIKWAKQSEGGGMVTFPKNPSKIFEAMSLATQEIFSTDKPIQPVLDKLQGDAEKLIK